MTSRDDTRVGPQIERGIWTACRLFAVEADNELVEGCCAEIPAILRDPQVRFAWLRTWHALAFAVGVVRSARKLRARKAARSLPADFRLAVLMVTAFTVLQSAFVAANDRGSQSPTALNSHLSFLYVSYCILLIRWHKIDSVRCLSLIREVFERLAVAEPVPGLR